MSVCTCARARAHMVVCASIDKIKWESVPRAQHINFGRSHLPRKIFPKTHFGLDPGKKKAGGRGGQFRGIFIFFRLSLHFPGPAPGEAIV